LRQGGPRCLGRVAAGGGRHDMPGLRRNESRQAWIEQMESGCMVQHGQTSAYRLLDVPWCDNSVAARGNARMRRRGRSPSWSPLACPRAGFSSVACSIRPWPGYIGIVSRVLSTSHEAEQQPRPPCAVPWGLSANAHAQILPAPQTVASQVGAVSISLCLANAGAFRPSSASCISHFP
jgi:hypothetical protein